MKIRSLIAGLLIVAACGGGGDPSVPSGQDDGLITGNVERSQEVADQASDRENQLEQIVEEMGG